MLNSVILNCICMVICLVTEYYIAGKENGTDKKLASAQMLVSLLYCFSQTIEIFIPYFPVKELSIINENFTVLMVGLLFALYVVYMIRVSKTKIKKWYLGLHIALYAFFCAALIVTPYVHWFYKKIEVIKNKKGLWELQIEYGVGYYLFAFLIILSSIWTIVMAGNYYRKVRKDSNEGNRKRALILLCVAFVPILVAVLFLFDIKSVYDLACYGMGISGLLLMYAMIRCNYLGIVQDAKDMVVEEMECGLLIYDRDYRFLEVNRFMREHFAELLERRETLEGYEDIKEILDGEQDRLEWKEHVYSCQRYEVSSQNNMLNGYAITVYDVTSLEEHIRESERLKDQAEKANNQKTKFLTNVTHEIRTPLNTILGMSEIALRKNTAKDLEAPLKTIYHEGEGVLEMINTLLDISKLESGTMELSHEMYIMEEILYEISNMVYMRIKKKNLDYRVEVEPGFPKAFFGDRMRVKEIFQNLLGNAIKYTECGNITLRLSGEKEEDGRFKVLLTVKDTGIGMSENDRENIFKRFMRCKNPKIETVFGAGLGLNITMNLVKIMGGDIQVQSRLDEGTTFMASFYQEIADSEPLILQDMTKEKAVNHMESNGFLDQIHVAFPGAHVLLVDDMESNLKVEQGLMQLYEIEPEMVLSGKEALHLVEQRKYDIIFLDHMMPEMDGIETLKRLRQMENAKNVPIVAITANSVVFNTDFYEKNGFDDSLTKPLHTSDLLAVLKKYLASKMQNKKTEETEELEENLPIKNLMPEIDCVVGIKNIGGNLEKYNELLQTYYGEMSQIIELLSDYANEDMEQFRIKVHGIKGGSRNIGAVGLADSALQLEEWAKEGKQAEILQELDGFLKQMDEVMTRIDTYLKDAVEQVERDGDFLPELDLNSVYVILKALSEFDMDEVEEAMKELYKNRYTDDTEAVLEELKRYIEDLDYKHATILLEDYLKKIS